MSGENKFAAHFTPLHESASSTLFERTLASAASLHGIGFVHGKDVTLTYRPAPASTGIRFRRVDLPKQPTIAARFEYLLHQNRRTAIGSGESIVEMTEHVLAPLFALGVTSAYIDIDGDETPAGDGSSLVFQNAIDRAGIRQLESTIRPAVIREPIRIDDGGASIEIRPASAPGLHITYELDYDHPGIGHQSHSAWIDSATFRRDIAAARTFVMEQEVAALRQMGIGIRQSARDLLVFASDGSLIDNQVRFPNECARHKLLDVVGDLALLGRPIWGTVFARRTGHRHNVALVRKIAEQFDRQQGNGEVIRSAA